MGAQKRKLAIIGFGSMGGMLAEGFLRSGRIEPSDLVLSTRRPETARDFASGRPGVMVAPSNRAAAMDASTVFLCVKPPEALDVLHEIAPYLTRDRHLISIVGSLGIDSLEGLCEAAVSLAVPSLASEVDAGLTLVSHGKRVSAGQAAALESLLAGIGAVRLFKGKDLPAASALSSCGPGLLAVILDEYASAAARHSGMSRADADFLLARAAFGTAKLLAERGLGFDEAYARVATEGGITEAGARALRARLPAAFDEMLALMARRRHERDQAMQTASEGRA